MRRSYGAFEPARYMFYFILILTVLIIVGYLFTNFSFQQDTEYATESDTIVNATEE